MPVIAVALQAGGVGKTTVTYNLGALLADRGRTVLLVDLDAQCNLTEACQIAEPQTSVYDSLAWIENPVPLAGAVLPVSGRDNLFVAPSSPKMAALDLALAAVDHREYRLREALEPLKDSYDYVLLDCPPGLGVVLLNALLASNEVLVPVQTRQRRVNALPVFLKTLVRAQRYHPDLRLTGIVPNQYDRRNSHDQQALAYIEHFAEKHAFTVFRAVPTTTRIPEAESQKAPLCDYDRNTPASDALEDLAERIDVRMAAPKRAHANGQLTAVGE